jgi:hypothetical protein
MVKRTSAEKLARSSKRSKPAEPAGPSTPRKSSSNYPPTAQQQTPKKNKNNVINLAGKIPEIPDEAYFHPLVNKLFEGSHKVYSKH